MDNQGHGRALNGATNYNSISVEICINSDGDFNKTYKYTVALFQALKKAYPNAVICRHYDVSRKNCPAFMRDANKFAQFVKEVNGPVHYKVDISKNSEIVALGQPSAPVVVQKPKVQVPTEKTKVVLFKGDGDKAIANLVAWAYQCPAELDNGTKKEDKYTIYRVGGEGKDRLESAVLALKKHLPKSFNNYLNIARLNTRIDWNESDKPLLVLYYGEGDKAIADLVAWKYKCEAKLDNDSANYYDTHNILYVGRGKDRIESAFEAIAKYLPDEYLTVAGEKPATIKEDPDSETIIVYDSDLGKAVAEMVAKHLGYKAVKNDGSSYENYHVISIPDGKDEIETTLFVLCKYFGDKVSRYL